MVNKSLIIVAMLLLVPLFLFAGTTGKLSGVVTDEKSGDPLIGVNVIIDGTSMGASTDIDGYYVILNVPAGVYSVTFTYIGYRTITYENIRIVPDITKRLDVGMEETAIELGEQIVVTADRPFFEASATNTVRVLESDQIQKVPVKGINQVVAINAGVVVSDGSGGDAGRAILNVRGGRGTETLVIVDGIPYNDALFGTSQGSGGTIPDAAVEQISTQLGGFSAKYGSAQSGIINIVTKGGSPKYFGSVEGVTSNYTDAYNYNQVTTTLGGPIYPGVKKMDFFGSFEYVQTDDPQPRVSGVKIPTVGIDQKVRPGMKTLVRRFTGKTNLYFGNLKATLNANGSFTDGRNYTHVYAKQNSVHIPRNEEDVFGSSLRLSQVFTKTAFLDVTFRYRNQYFQQGDGFWYDNLMAYGDSLANAAVGVTLTNGDGSRVSLVDQNNVFAPYGRVSNSFYKYRVQTLGGDLNFTKQFKQHLIEIGGMVEQDIVRYWWISPVTLAAMKNTRTLEERYFNSLNSFWGYDIYGNEINSTSMRQTSGDTYEQSGPKKPIIGAAYFQDKIEFNDFILNLGFRWDYFDPNFRRIKDVNNVLGNDGVLTPDDFEQAPIESYVSPRIGFAYPVTERTVFHAQYGVFRQIPRFTDLYDSWINLDDLENMDGQGQNLGHLKMESTSQYEFGFKQQIQNIASLDITAYYKNVKGLTNLQMQFFRFGQSQKSAIGAFNADFGTVKGLAFSFDLRRIGPFSAKLDYTLALSEGTGSSQSGAFVAVFRSRHNEAPRTIAPLNFDQRHTLTFNLDIRAGRDQGPQIFGYKLFENAGANFLVSYESGRPYTPLQYVNLLAGTSNYGNLTQYVNSAYAGGVFRIDLKVNKDFDIGRMTIVPYLWIQNLLNRRNYIDVYGSTGEPDNTAYLLTQEAQGPIQTYGQGFISDYKARELDPENFGLPRIIRLGLRVEF